MSTPTSWPLRFITLPPISTVSTFCGPMLVTTAPTALFIGMTLSRSVRSMMMSASLPGVSVPIFFSRPLARAPSMVANSSTSRAVRNLGGFLSPASRLAHTSFFCSENTVRIWVKKSFGTEVSTSTLSDGRMPMSIAFWVGGLPWPISVST